MRLTCALALDSSRRHVPPTPSPGPPSAPAIASSSSGAARSAPCACSSCRGTFAAEIVVVEPDRRRAEVAGCCGATSTLHPDEASTRNETFDVVIEAAGVPSAARTSVELARRSGRIVLAGIPDQTATLVVRDVVSKRLEIATTFGAPHGAWRAAVDAFNAGRLDPGQLVTHELDLAGAADALALLARGGDEIGKILLRP